MVRFVGFLCLRIAAELQKADDRRRRFSANGIALGGRATTWVLARFLFESAQQNVVDQPRCSGEASHGG
jgi:hypothetical protein